MSNLIAIQSSVIENYKKSPLSSNGYTETELDRMREHVALIDAAVTMSNNTWDKIDTKRMLNDLKTIVKLGLNPNVPNHIFWVVRKNKKQDNLFVSPMIGYMGMLWLVEKYSFEPIDIVVNIIREKDQFKIIKRSFKNPKDDYEFEITDAFDRGEIKGGLVYINYRNNQIKNETLVLSKADVEKRKPLYISGDFWTKYYEEMFRKTLVRYATRRIPINIPDEYKEIFEENELNIESQGDIVIE